VLKDTDEQLVVQLLERLTQRIRRSLTGC